MRAVAEGGGAGGVRGAAAMRAVAEGGREGGRRSRPGTINKKVSVGRDVYIRDWTGYRGVTSGKLAQYCVNLPQYW